MSNRSGRFFGRRSGGFTCCGSWGGSRSRVVTRAVSATFDIIDGAVVAKDSVLFGGNFPGVRGIPLQIEIELGPCARFGLIMVAIFLIQDYFVTSGVSHSVPTEGDASPVTVAVVTEIGGSAGFSDY